MNSSQLIALNTAASYIRSLIAAVLSLFSSRWVLGALGEIDYGLFSLIGSILIFVSFLNIVMSGSASRHFAYSIGQGNSTEVNHWFNAALSIHLSLAVGLTFFGWLAGEYVIAEKLNIPADRLSVCIFVFRVSLISLFVGMSSVPFIAMFRAKQNIAELSAFDLLYSVLSFSFAWYLTYYHGNSLALYAIGMTAIPVFIYSIQIFRAVTIFQECTISYNRWFDRVRVKEIFSFAIWSLIGTFGSLLRDQGSALLLNLFFGARINAAYGIANKVSTQTGQLAGAMLGAFSPEITSSEGRGDRARMIALSLRACKIGTILIMFFTIPLLIEMDYVLKLWLCEPPAYTASFCRLILCTFLIDRLSTGYMLAVNAGGKIAAYQATLGTILVLTLPLAWLFLKLGYAPTSVAFAFVITMTLCSVGRVLWVRKLYGVPVIPWITAVIVPCSIVACAALVVAVMFHWIMQTSFIRLVLVSSVSGVFSLLTTWFFALNQSEREFFRQNIRLLYKRINGILPQPLTGKEAE